MITDESVSPTVTEAEMLTAENLQLRHLLRLAVRYQFSYKAETLRDYAEAWDEIKTYARGNLYEETA